MELTQLQQNWETLAQQDPMWAIVSRPDKKGRQWDPEAFFQLGQTEIKHLLGDIEVAQFPLNRGTALDFGCGLGRLTQALCPHFEKAYGVDISPTMIAGANHYNRFGTACSYVLNHLPDLRCFEDNTFDFIYSNIVLQHIPPEASKAYIAEFVRVLRPGGLLIFQIPSGLREQTPKPTPPVDAMENSSAKAETPGVFGKLKNAFSRWRQAETQPAPSAESPKQPETLERLIDMHVIPREEVCNLIESAHGTIIQLQEDHWVGPEWESFRYWVTKS